MHEENRQKSAEGQWQCRPWLLFPGSFLVTPHSLYIGHDDPWEGERSIAPLQLLLLISAQILHDSIQSCIVLTFG